MLDGSHTVKSGRDKMLGVGCDEGALVTGDKDM